MIYLEDLHEGRRFRSGRLTITADDIHRFATEFDPQPFHIDERAAAASLFKGLAASGWHTASLTMRLIVDSIPIAGGIIGAGMDELSWPRPTRPGDALCVISEVIATRPSRSRPGEGIAKIRSTTLNQNEEHVQVMTANLIVPRRVASG